MCSPTPQVSDTEREGSWSPGRGDRALATRSHKAPSRHDRPRLSPQPSRPQPQRPQEVPGVVPPAPGSSKWGNGHVVASHYSGAQKPQDTRGEALKHRLEGSCPPPGPQGQRPHGPLGHQSNFTPRSAASAQRSATRVRAPRRETGPSPPCAGLKSRQEFWQIYRRKQEKRVTQTPRGCQCAHRAGQA